MRACLSNNTIPSTFRSAFEPSPSSIAHRTRLAQLISPLRRVRPRVPFWQLAAHRIPTLWGLYRGLIKEAPDAQIRWRIRKLFYKNRNQTGSERTIESLKLGYKYLDTFRRASQGDQKLVEVLKRYARLIEVKREKEHWKQVIREELAWLERLATRPRLTGALSRASLDNRPLPILIPQPAQYGAILRCRKRGRELRLKRQRRLVEMKRDVEVEIQFEEGVRQSANVPKGEIGAFTPDTKGDWFAPINDSLDTINASYTLDRARLTTPPSPTLVALLSQARRYKIENKTREKEQKRSGVITRKLEKKMRGGPPAHVLITMGQEERTEDRLLRGGSWGGVVGRVKRERGVKTWRYERIGADGEMKSGARSMDGIGEASGREQSLGISVGGLEKLEWDGWKEEAASEDSRKREEEIFSENARRQMETW